MLEGLYSAAAGTEAQQQRLDAISNDLANLDTPGYQSERVGFEDLLYSSAGATQGAGVTTGAGAAATDLGPSQIMGTVGQTGQPLDLAINGDAYFEVKQPDGTNALTRNGQFQIDGKGQLTTPAGMLVQPPITVPPGTLASDVSVSPGGIVSVQGKTLGTINLVTVAAPGQLQEAGGSLLLATAASGAIVKATGSTVVQGSLNSSDVNLANEMVQMMDVEQSYSMSSKAMNIETQMLQIANQVRG
jgi:flagellar basal-body rod protein FlgG